MSRQMTIRASATTLAALALCAAGGAAIAQVSGSEPADPQQRPNPVITQIDAEQAASFAVLRGDAGSAAVFTPAAQRLVDIGLGPDVGASAALSRRAGTTPDGDPLYVVPGQGWVCVVTGDGSGGCNRTAEVVAGYGVKLQRRGSAVELEGVVPDGVSTVQVAGATSTVDVSVQANAWSAIVAFEPSVLRWTGPNGSHEVPVWAPTAGEHGPPTAGEHGPPPGG